MKPSPSTIERHGATLSGTSEYVQTRPRPRNVRFDYGPASDAELTPSQKFRVTSSPVTFR